jgi:hypothetical protein
MMASTCNNVFELRMQQRLASAKRDCCCSKVGESINTLQKNIRWNRVGKIVKLVTVGAREVAASNGNKMRENRVLGREQPPRKELRFAKRDSEFARGLHPRARADTRSPALTPKRTGILKC